MTNSHDGISPRGTPVLVMMSAAFALLSGCYSAVDAEEAEPVQEARSSLTLTGQTFRLVTFTSATPSERCRVPPVDPNATPKVPIFAPNTQLTIKRRGVLMGICTVESTTSSDPTVFEMNEAAYGSRVAWSSYDSPTLPLTTLPEVEVSNEYAPGVAPAIAAPATSMADAQATSWTNHGVMEYTYRGPSAGVVYAVAHPTERGAFDQVKLIHESDTARNGVWAAAINGNPQSGATVSYHITSTQISPLSFPGMNTFITNPLPYSVSFHASSDSSCNNNTHVRVGGRMEGVFRQGMAEIVRDELASVVSGLNVRWSQGCEPGNGLDNFVNKMARRSRGVQIEQRFSAIGSFPDRRDAVARAVKSVYDCLLDAPDVLSESPGNPASPTTFLADSADASYANGSVCPRFIAEVDIVNAAGGHTHSIRPTVCQAGDQVHVDYYWYNAPEVAYERLGGGDITYDAACTPTYAVDNVSAQFTYIDPGNLAIGSSGKTRIRAVARAKSAGGALKAVRFAID
ncbi:hypothetical protein WME79_38670 [Sorangium sp. So ce726]|uniref:hypothetical protein n=1 Tax=Sorangium sp. So ce726 TaxID=3133319 RepID=UPI003F6092DE